MRPYKWEIIKMTEDGEWYKARYIGKVQGWVTEAGVHLGLNPIETVSFPYLERMLYNEKKGYIP